MGRWEPDARGRLRGAALELFAEQGFEQTTAQQIAQRAGVTERTYFRHFTDKREVLFAGSAELQDAVLDAIAAAPASLSAVETMVAAMQTAAAVIGGNRDYSRVRQTVISAHAQLQERELLKLANLAAAAAAALRERGVPDAVAGLAAQTGVTVFSVGFESWLGEGVEDDFPAAIREAYGQLRALTAGV